jgi:hypothetical protein
MSSARQPDAAAPQAVRTRLMMWENLVPWLAHCKRCTQNTETTSTPRGFSVCAHRPRAKTRCSPAYAGRLRVRHAMHDHVHAVRVVRTCRKIRARRDVRSPRSAQSENVPASNPTSARQRRPRRAIRGVIRTGETSVPTSAKPCGAPRGSSSREYLPGLLREGFLHFSARAPVKHQR